MSNEGKQSGGGPCLFCTGLSDDDRPTHCSYCDNERQHPASGIVKDGIVVYLGGLPGNMDAHVRGSMLILRCERDWITGEPRVPFSVSLNRDDMNDLRRVLDYAADADNARRARPNGAPPSASVSPTVLQAHILPDPDQQ